MGYIIIPQSDLDALERERKRYYDEVAEEQAVFHYIKSSNLTGRIWTLTHKRYKKLSLWNLIKTKLTKEVRR